MKTIQIHRYPRTENYSIERVFNSVNVYMPSNVNKLTVPISSSGIINRLRIIFFTRKFRNHLVHITGDIMFAGVLNKNVILTYHDLEFINRADGLKKKLLTWFWVKLPIRRAQAVTVISQSTLDEINKHIDLKNKVVHMIPNPLTINKVQSIKIDIHFPFKKFVLQVGTKSNKNLDRIAEACKNGMIPLVIVGKLSDEQLLLLKEFDVNYQNFIGIENEHMIYLYQQALLLSFCSTEEGFGLPIIEAQFLSCPVLTSNISSMPEVGGEAAHYVNPYSVEQIRDGISQINSDIKYRNQLINKGLENIKRFNPKVIANQYKVLYDKILS